MASTVLRSALQSVKSSRAPLLKTARPMQPKRGMVIQPLAMGNPYFEEEQMRERMTIFHIEAMEAWREEAKALSNLMVNDDISKSENLPKEVNKIVDNQIQGLFEELIEEDLLDPRLGWKSYDY